MTAILRYVDTLRWHFRAGPSSLLLAIAGRFKLVRSVVTRCHGLARQPPAPAILRPRGLVQEVELWNAKRILDRDGVFAGLQLVDHLRHDVHEALLRNPCYGAGRSEFPFQYREKEQAEGRFGRKFAIAHYYGLHRIAPMIDELAHDSTLMQMARNYFGTEPRCVGMRAWWSFACNASEDERVASGQTFHYDIDDYRALSAFFYLTDVDSSLGPHVCIRGSHRKKPLKYVLSPSRSRTEEELYRYYDRDRELELCGTSGFGFMEDTFCFHRGVHPRRGDRLMLQLRYAIRDHGACTDEMSADWAGRSR